MHSKMIMFNTRVEDKTLKWLSTQFLLIQNSDKSPPLMRKV